MQTKEDGKPLPRHKAFDNSFNILKCNIDDISIDILWSLEKAREISKGVAQLALRPSGYAPVLALKLTKHYSQRLRKVHVESKLIKRHE